MSRDPVVHELKCAFEFFEDVWTGRKPFEVRKNDRDYRPGDVLYIRELDKAGFYTPRGVVVRACYVLEDFIGLKKGYCVIGLAEPDQADLDLVEATHG